MPRDIPIGNGSMLIAYDKWGILRDLYFPHVGSENHAQCHPFKIGVWINGTFTWIDDALWERTLDYEDDTLVARIELRNRKYGAELTLRDAVDFHENLYVREITAKNLLAKPAEMRIFFHHDFHIYGTEIGDTACYKPEEKGLLHYKGMRYFLINASTEENVGVSYYATGIKESKGMKGTWIDAEDGILSGNPVAQGSVDSTCAVHLKVPAGGQARAYYWMGIANDWKGVKRLNTLVLERSPVYFIKRTADYWKLWVHKEGLNFDDLPAPVVRLYERSLLVLRTNVDNNGAITAANDTDILDFSRDTYSYVWPRDGAITAHALSVAGYSMPARRFFNFCGEIIEREGFFWHKYNPDGSLASSWHPWVLNGSPSLPIQEDETGLVVWALWEHFSLYRDLEFIKPLYKKVVKSAADFMCNFIEPDTGLPLPSYDLWEERHGIHAFTISSVIAGLRAAANFTDSFGETELSEKYLSHAARMQEAFIKYLYGDERKRFLNRIYRKSDGTFQKDFTMDASLYGIFAFGVFPASDERVTSTMKALRDALWCRTKLGGMARYENDSYQAVVQPNGDIPGNPWIICTLWYAQYLIAKADDEAELNRSLEVMNWVVERALQSGTLAEQVDPITGAPVSVSPLTWSHAEFVIAVQMYLDKLQKVRICPHCHQPSFLKRKLA